MTKERHQMTKNFMQLINNDYKELFQFKSSEIEVEIDNRIDIITKAFKENQPYKLNYDDLVYYEHGISIMPSYYGARWTSEVYFPFLQKHNPNTLLVIELIILFYAKSIYQMVCSDIQVVNQLEKENQMFFDKNTMLFLLTTNKSSERYKVRPLIYYVSILKKLFANQPTTRELTIYGGEDIFYITSEMYSNITDKLLEDSDEVRYKGVIQSMVGIYRLYYNKIEYFTEIQPLFLKIIHDSLLNFNVLLSFNNQYLEEQQET